VELRATGLTFAYGGARRPALDQVSLTIGSGVTALVGVNGAGKTTLLQVLARALRPGEGAVVLDGVDVHRARRSEVAPRIALMPQDFVLPSGTRVLDGLAYLAWRRGVPARQAVVRSQELLALVGLGDRGAEKVSALSGGMVRRLAFAQALASRPDVLLLDEPTTGLDPEQRSVVRELITDPERQAPITVISSHLMEDVGVLADQVLMLDGGTVLFAGSLEEFRVRPDGTSDEPDAAFLRRLFEATR
jgi:ABC-2 type transport system ATP-binding protein